MRFGLLVDAPVQFNDSVPDVDTAEPEVTSILPKFTLDTDIEQLIAANACTVSDKWSTIAAKRIFMHGTLKAEFKRWNNYNSLTHSANVLWATVRSLHQNPTSRDWLYEVAPSRLMNSTR